SSSAKGASSRAQAPNFATPRALANIASAPNAPTSPPARNTRMLAGTSGTFETSSTTRSPHAAPPTRPTTVARSARRRRRPLFSGGGGLPWAAGRTPSTIRWIQTLSPSAWRALAMRRAAYGAGGSVDDVLDRGIDSVRVELLVVSANPSALQERDLPAFRQRSAQVEEDPDGGPFGDRRRPLANGFGAALEPDDVRAGEDDEGVERALLT